MRAILFEAPRKVRLVDDAPKPEPRDGEVLVQCRYIALCGTNMGPYTGDGRWAKGPWPPPLGWLGHENIGVVVESRAAGWEPGAWVLAHPEDYNGFVEFIVSKPAGLARLPADAPDPAALIAAQPLATVLRALARTGNVIRPAMLRLPYPYRWYYDILRALDYFRYAGVPYDDRMEDALDHLEKKRRKDHTWPLQAKIPGKTHFDMEKSGRPSRWNTLRAMRVRAYFNREG